MQSLTRKAHALRLKPHFLRSQHVVFPQNRLATDLGRATATTLLPVALVTHLITNVMQQIIDAMPNYTGGFEIPDE